MAEPDGFFYQMRGPRLEVEQPTEWKGSLGEGIFDGTWFEDEESRDDAMHRTESLLQAAREYRALNLMTDEERSAQARSFAYGNVALHNAAVTREMVDEEARKLGKR